MKKILSTVLALCMILGCVAVGFTAQAATGADLQAAINDAINTTGELDWTRGNVQLTNALTINGNVKIDFNGATILGAPHKNTIVINGGKVELINADVEGTGAAYHYIDGFVEEVSNACPTILIGNADVTLTDFIVTGAYIRVVGTHPKTGEKLPMSDAITMGNANGVLTLNNVRAFGNNGVENLNGARVNVVDCLVGGYINDFYNDAAVSFADGTTQYSGFELFQEALADEVELTEGEADLISSVLGRWLEVTASVKNQRYDASDEDCIKYSYDADTDTLTVTATADKSYETQAECAFDYYYVPKTASIFGNEPVNFVKTAPLTYTATFEGVGPNISDEVTVLYKLAVDLGEDARTKINDGINMIDGAVDTILGMIPRVDTEINDAIVTYLTGNQGFASIIWNAYNEIGIDDLLTDLQNKINNYETQIAQMPDGPEKDEAVEALADARAEKAKAESDIKALFGPIFDICGYSLKGDTTINTILAKMAAGTETNEAKKDRARDEVNTMNEKYGSHLNAETGARGYVDVFLSYWRNVRNALEAKDFKALGEYVGANYNAFYQFLKDLRDCALGAINLLNDPNSYVTKLLNENNITIEGKPVTSYIGDLNGVIDLINTGFSYVDGLFNSSMYTNMVNKYGSQIPKLCGIYAEKAYDIVTNPNKYFTFETDGTLVEGYEFNQTLPFETPADVNEVTVKVQVSGYGKAMVPGDLDEHDEQNYVTAGKEYSVPMGSTFTVEAIDYDGFDQFMYYAIDDTNGNSRLNPTGGNITVYSNTIITLYFGNRTDVNDEPQANVVFMTNYELSNAWIDTIVAGEIEELPEPFDFETEKTAFIGWAAQDVSGATAETAGLLLNESDLINAANAATEDTIFYAIYKSETTLVSTDELNSTVLTMKDVTLSGNMAYFTILVSDRPLAEGETIVAAGILAAKSEATINAATPDGGPGIAKGTLNLNAYSLPSFYVHAIYSRDGSAMTAYAKGFVTIKDANGNYNTIYTPVFSQAIPAAA